MTDIKRVKIQNFIESQIPEFLNEDNPLFKEFLSSYYLSLEHQTGTIDIANNLGTYKEIENFNPETFYSQNFPSNLTKDLEAFESTISVNHTTGFPEKYGLLKIDNEIITYESKTNTTFEGCIRGFSGIEKPNLTFTFSSTEADLHSSGTTVQNLNISFFSELFKKLKYQFIPGFENRDFVSGINLKSILSRARDFYSSKGTDASYKILFKILFGEDVEIVKPQDYMLRPSDNNYFVTKNILVEKVLGDIDPLQLIGYTLHQETKDGIASAAIHNVEIRPFEEGFLYEVSLDPSSFILNFTSTKKTKILEDSSIDTIDIIVDSTIGFSTTSLLVDSVNSPSPYYIKYTEKTTNQFLGVSNLLTPLSKNDVILEDNFAFATIDDDTVYFRILNIIDSLDYSDTFGLRVGDKINLSSFGAELNDDNPYFNSWIYNIPTRHTIKNIIATSQPKVKRIELVDGVNFVKNEKVELYNSDDIDSIPIIGTIKSILDPNTIEIESVVEISDVNILSKIITKSNAINYPEINNVVSNIQNTYTDYSNEFLYITSSGIPDYTIFADNRKILLGTKNNPNINSGIGYTNIIDTNKEHKFYPGEKVFLIPSPKLGISTGTYFVNTIGNYSNSTQITLSYSNSDLFSGKYVNVSYGATGEIVKLDYEYKSLEHQKLLKKIVLSNEDKVVDEYKDKTTNNKPIGLLLNGVEIYSPTLYDENIYYGKINDIQVTNFGSGYDVVNTPELFVVDEINGVTYGEGAKVHLILNGEVSGIKIVNPGSGYTKDMKISLVGGNGTEALLEANIIKDRVNSGFRGDGFGVNPTENSIQFTGPHNFEDGEIIEYYPNSNREIEYSDPIIRLINNEEVQIGSEIRKLSANSFYYAGVISSTKIKLYRTKEDAANKVNEINLTTSPSAGFHYFRSIQSKNTLVGISVKNSGSGYSNRKIIIDSIDDDYEKQNGININDDYIFARDHYFKDKDVVVYSTTGTSIDGLETTKKYYVKVIDENKFKLALAGVGNELSDLDYKNKKFVRFNSFGSGKHTFSYPPIEIKIGASLESSNGNLILPTLEPIVLGKVENVFVEEYGSKYGTPNIINFHRRPEVFIGNITSEAIFKPLIIDGKIIDVQILNYGKGYGKDVDLIISGAGNFADIYPIIVDGKIVSVSIINGGIGYNENTTIVARPRGKNAKFIVNVFQWKINQVEKNKYLLENSDEGILVPSKNQQSGLQFVHFYPPKILREKLGDNLDINYTELLKPNTSPILGWSYDGFPIYGPYSVVDNTIQRSKSSYLKVIETDPNLRPTGNMFPGGFFTQDFIYNSSIGDLDEYNGKFVKNSDFPNGTYAYFFTIDVDSNNNSIPTYPYVVADSFKNHYVSENYEPSYNQDLDFSKLNLIRNTSPYYLNSTTSYYDLLSTVYDKYKQEFIVDVTSSAGIDSISIYNPGDEYKVNDIVNFENSDSGSGVYASISEIRGRDIDAIDVGISTYYPIVFSKYSNKVTGTYSGDIDIIDNDSILVSDVSNIGYKFLEGIKSASIFRRTIGLSTDILIGAPGDIIPIYPIDTFGFEIDDNIQIDEERFKIIDIIEENSSFIVKRLTNPGVHTSGISQINLVPRRFTYLENDYKLLRLENKSRYFDPETQVPVGGTYKPYTLPNSSTISIPERSIYIKDHSYNTGQPLKYNVGSSGTGIYVSNDGINSYQLEDNQIVYAVNLGKDFLGISTVGFNTSVNGIGVSNYSLYFNSPVIGIGAEHKFTTTYEEITGKVEYFSLEISTKEPHNLLTGDIVTLNVVPNIQKIIKFRYDNVIRKVTTDLIEFNAASVNLNSSEIEIDTTELKTGDKIVYYNVGNSVIGGLASNGVYFIIIDSPGKIKLSNYYSDSLLGKNITLTSVGAGTQKIAKINPQLSLVKGDYVIFDLSDSSMVNLDMKLYKDVRFKRELETYNYVTNNGEIYINTLKNSYPREIYYSFSISNQLIYPDQEVRGYSSIEIDSSEYNIPSKILKIDDYKFRINLYGKPNNLISQDSKFSDLYYTTKSKNAKGPIERVKINSFGKGYKKSPKIRSISSDFGKNAVLKVNSSKVGKISSTKRVKDGFDYPTDITLLPSLNAPAVVNVSGISRVESVGVITGGINYNSKPTLKVIGNDDLILDPILEGTSIVGVNIVQNVSNLSNPLRIVPTRNSNGYSIDDITVNGTEVTLELLNSDIQIYPLINTGYGTTNVIFPFEIGDEIFIERCRLEGGEVDANGDLVERDNFNSSDYGYRFFTVTGVSTTNYTVTYDIDGESNNLGTYTPDFGYGYVINRKDMAEFEMSLINDLKYYSGETVLGYNTNNINTFSAKVLEDGWDNDIDELRLTNVKGELNIGDTLRGQKSLLNGIVKDVNIFSIRSNVDITRDKIDDFGDRVGFLNDFQQRISDNNYYQKFSYSIKGKVPYNNWKEPIKSTIHPSGFKEFSDLTILGGSSASMKVGAAASLDLTVNIDNFQSLNKKNNLAMVTEDDQFEDRSIERIIFDGGVTLKPYILSKSNSVLTIDDISTQFDGTSKFQIVENKNVTFISTDLYRLGVSTDGLKVGDKIGYSTYHFYPESTYILSIGKNYIGISTYTPHRVYSENGVSKTIVENLNFYRRIPGDLEVGKKSFKLTSGGYSLFYKTFDASNGINTPINLEQNIFTIPNHNFNSGQKIKYLPIASMPVLTEFDSSFSYPNYTSFSSTIFTFDNDQVWIATFDSN